MNSDEAFTGYWNRPDADEKAIGDGWYHTGDVGRLDEDGDLWIARPGRRHDHLGRRERPPARGRGRAGAPSAGCRGGGRRSAGRPARAARRRGRRRRGRADRGGARRLLPRRPRPSRGSSGRASTASSSRFRRAPLGRSCDGCYERRHLRDPIRGDPARRLQGRARRRARRRHDHARRPGQAQPRLARGARRQLAAAFAELGEDDGVRDRRADRRRRARSPPAATSPRS